MKNSITIILCAALMLVFGVAVGAESKEISYGAEYTLVTAASEAYPDDGIKLTDGIYGTHAEGTDGYYASGAYVGFNKAQVNENGKFAIILDLGQSYSQITELTVGYLCETSVGVYAPASVAFSASDDRNGSYHLLGELETAPEDATAAATYAKTLTIDASSGRYVLVTITPSGYTDKNDTTSIAPWTFIDEISIRANDTAGGETSDGETSNGDTSDGETSNGETSNGDTSDGETSDGVTSEDDTSNGETSNGETSDGDTTQPPDTSDNSDDTDTSNPPNTSDTSADTSGDTSTPTDDELDKTPQTGDDLTIFAFVLLALAAVTMMIALFSTKRSESKF